MITFKPYSLYKIITLLLYFTAGIGVNSTHGQTKGICDTALASGEQLFQDKRYQESIDMVQGCLNKFPSDSQNVSVFRLLIYDNLSLDAKDENGTSKSLTWDLHKKYSWYRPDTLKETRQYIRWVNDFIAEYDSLFPPRGTLDKIVQWIWENKYYVGGVVVAGGVAAAILLKNGNETGLPPLPGPPGLP